MASTDGPVRRRRVLGCRPFDEKVDGVTFRQRSYRKEMLTCYPQRLAGW